MIKRERWRSWIVYLLALADEHIKIAVAFFKTQWGEEIDFLIVKCKGIVEGIENFTYQAFFRGSCFKGRHFFKGKIIFMKCVGMGPAGDMNFLGNSRIRKKVFRMMGIITMYRECHALEDKVEYNQKG